MGFLSDNIAEKTILGAIADTGADPHEWYKKAGLMQGLGRLAGQYVVDPVAQAAPSINKGMTGQQLTPYDVANTFGLLADVGATTSVASGLMGGVNPNVVSMFVSPSKKELKLAQEMAEAGIPREQIHKELLMHKKPDGFWRKEIDDSGARLNPEGLTWGTTEDIKAGNTTTALLSDFFNHPEHDPGRMVIGFSTGRRGGSYGDNSINMGIGKDLTFNSDQKNTLFHELQHAVQDKEGWARGGSPGDKTLPTVNELGENINLSYKNKIEDIRNSPEYKKYVADILKDADPNEYIGRNGKPNEFMMKHDAEWSADTHFGIEDIEIERQSALDKIFTEGAFLNNRYPAYRNLLGEREARDTASRINLGLDERRGLMPDFGDDAIVRMK